MRKYFCFTFIVFLFLSNSVDAQEFQLYDANVRRWNAGQKRSGYGYDYHFRFKAMKNLKNIEIKGVWIDTLFYESKIFVNEKEMSSNFSIKKGERILVRTNVRFVPNELEEYKSNYIADKNEMPKIRDNNFKALVYYTHKGKRRYHIIYEIENLPSLNMP